MKQTVEFGGQDGSHSFDFQRLPAKSHTFCFTLIPFLLALSLSSANISPFGTVGVEKELEDV